MMTVISLRIINQWSKDIINQVNKPQLMIKENLHKELKALMIFFIDLKANCQH